MCEKQMKKLQDFILKRCQNNLKHKSILLIFKLYKLYIVSGLVLINMYTKPCKISNIFLLLLS
jgi:hypothetical protein